MTGSKRKLTREEYLKAFALLTIANNYYTKINEFERVLAKMLWPDDQDNQGYLSDAIYSDTTPSLTIFEEALKNDGFEFDKLSAPHNDPE